MKRTGNGKKVHNSLFQRKKRLINTILMVMNYIRTKQDYTIVNLINKKLPYS